jgi:hypothetical protein
VAAKGDSASVFDDWLIILVHGANSKILFEGELCVSTGEGRFPPFYDVALGGQSLFNSWDASRVHDAE